MELITNQRKIPREKWRYGLRSSAATGCGWIACYNALLLLKRPEPPERVLGWLSRRRPLVNGLCGTTFGSMLAFCKNRGLAVSVGCKKKQLDRLVRENEVSILFYFWRRGWRIGAHYVTLVPEGDGLVGYNVYRNVTGPVSLGESLIPFLKSFHGGFPVIIALRKP